MAAKNATAIAVAAIDWQRRHREAIRLLAERNSMPCERQEAPHDGRIEPCFKDYCEPGRQPDDAPTTAPVSEWCPSCQKRHEIHAAYRATRKAAGIANRRLQALCRAEKS